MITSIRLKNWKSHEDTTFKLGSGTNVLVGGMGSGKSATLEAICYALFGTVPAVQSRTVRLDDLIKDRPVRKDSAEVEVGFLSSVGEEYVAKRAIERGSGTVFAELRRRNGDLIERPSSKVVTGCVASLIQLDYDIFERMIYAEQNSLDYFLTLPPMERRRRLDGLFGIDKLEQARKNASTLVNRVNDWKKDQKENVKELQKDEEIKSLPELEKSFQEAMADVNTLEARRKKLEPELDEIEKRLERYKELENKINKVNRKISERKATIRTLNRRVNQIEEKLGKDVDVRIEDLEEFKSKLEGSYERFCQKVEELNSTKSTLTSKISELKTKKALNEERINGLSCSIGLKEDFKKELQEIRLPDLSKTLNQLQSRLEKNKEKRTALHTRIEDLEQTLNELKKAGRSCPVCETPIPQDRRERIVHERSNRIKGLREEYFDLKDERTMLEEEIQDVRDLEKRGKELKEKVKDLPELLSEHADLEKEHQKINFELNEAEALSAENERDLNRFKEGAEESQNKLVSVKKKIELCLELDEANGERKKEDEEKNCLQKELEEYREDYDENKARELENRSKELNGEIGRIQERIFGIRNLLQEREERIKSIQKKKETLGRKKTQVKYLKAARDSLSKVEKAFSNSQTSLRRHIIEAVNDAMNDLWGSIYPYNDYPSIRLFIEQVREGISDYVLQLGTRSGNWVPIQGIASGGERVCACLAFRIAFANVLAPNLRWIILDEPTHNLDLAGIEKLARVLRERVPKIIDQLVLITHETRLEAAVSGYLYRFSRDKDKDGPTNVQQISVLGG